MAIEFDAAELTETLANVTACGVAFPNLTWKYKTAAPSQVEYWGSDVTVMTNGLSLVIVVPLSSGTVHDYDSATWYIKANPSSSIALPEPDAGTRSAMTSITEVLSYATTVMDFFSPV